MNSSRFWSTELQAVPAAMAQSSCCILVDTKFRRVGPSPTPSSPARRPRPTGGGLAPSPTGPSGVVRVGHPRSHGPRCFPQLVAGLSPPRRSPTPLCWFLLGETSELDEDSATPTAIDGLFWAQAISWMSPRARPTEFTSIVFTSRP